MSTQSTGVTVAFVCVRYEAHLHRVSSNPVTSSGKSDSKKLAGR